MSVVGFDIGNENCVIAVAKRGGIDVLLNDESKRETPAVVSFGEKQRFLGSAGAAFATKNLKSTISQIKRLIGRPYNEPSVQEDLRLLPFKTSEGPHGAIWIHIQNFNQEWTFLPVEILAMLFAHLKQVTEKNLASRIEDCVIGIPSYFTDLQRREYLNAAFIAGLRPWRLLHDCTAVALGYGMYKTDFSNKGPTNVMFVDVGQCDTQVTVAAFEKGGMKILSHSFDQHLGGRDFDDVLYRHFAAEFKNQYDIDIDVTSNVRASLRLRASCEKLKKVLSANAEAPLSIDSLIGDKDVSGVIKREEFENLSMELIERITNVCFKAVDDSGLRVEKIHCIELVGSGSRIPAITRKLTSLFGREPMRTLNGSECVARGCALYCAMLSPTFSVPGYKVEDIFPYSVGLYFDDGRHPEFTPFPKGSPIPSKETVTYHGNTTFRCEVSYTKLDFPSGVSPIVGRFMIRPHQTSDAQNVEVTVNVQLNIHGIFEIKSASFVEVIRPLLGRMVSAMSNTFMRNDVADHKPAGSSQSTAHHTVEPRRGSDRRNDVADHKPAGSSQSTAHHAVGPRRGPDRRNGVADHKTAGSSQSTAHHAVEPRRGPDRRQNLAVSKNDVGFTTTDELQEAKRRAQEFADQDIKAEQTKEKRNTLESFIYDNRSKLLSSYRSVATDSEVEIISKSLQDTEDWLYEEGDDESEQAYIRKLEDLKKLLEPIENKYKDENDKKEAIKALQTCIQEKHSEAELLSPTHKKEVNNECSNVEDWLEHLLKLQDSFEKHATPIYCTGAINGITQALKRRCKDITSKPSLPKYDEPVESDQKQSLDDMECDN